MSTLERDPVRSDSSVHWSGMRERGVFAGLWFMLQCYRLFGRVGFGLFLVPVITYFFLSDGRTRSASRSFLDRVWAYPEGRHALGSRPNLFCSFRHYMSFGSAILDKVASWTGDIRPEHVDYHNRDLLDRVLAEGRGGVMIGSHLGNLELCRALGSLHQHLKINVVVHTAHAAGFNRLLAQANPSATLNMIQTSSFGVDTAILLKERVDRGELVVIVGDRTPASGGRRICAVPFLGADAAFPEGPFILASLMACPVLLVFCVREGWRHRIIFEALDAEGLQHSRRNRQENLRKIITSYAARLEYYALRYPLQWFNFFDFWALANIASASGMDTKKAKDDNEY